MTWLPADAMGRPQNVGETVPSPFETPAPPAICVPEAPGSLGQLNGAGLVAWHTNGKYEKMPYCMRAGLSNSTLFQIEFS